MASLLVASAATSVNYLQSPRPDPYRTVRFLSGDWWRYPLERNPWKRLQSVDSDLNSVFVLPGSGKLWAVGSAGTIVESADGGSTWEKQVILPAAKTARFPERCHADTLSLI